MSIFEFAFSLFGLLLGLSLAEVLGGFARSIADRKSVRLGLLTPLLGALVFMDLVGFWSAAWMIRDEVQFSYPFMLAITTFAGCYYVAAYLVFPRAGDGITKLDEHYFAVRRPVFGILLAASLAQAVGFIHFGGWEKVGPSFFISISPYLVLLIVNMFVRGKWTAPIMLGLTVAYYFANFLPA